MGKQLLDFISERSSVGEPMAIVTRLSAEVKTQKFVVTPETSCHLDKSVDLQDEIVSKARELIAGHKTAAIIEGRLEAGQYCTYVIDVIRPKPSLVIFGAGHVGQAVALIGALLGYEVTVVDDRDEFLSRARLPDNRIRMMRSMFKDAARDVRMTRNTAAVIVTRGHQYDEICLRGVVGSPACYIGMIGSRRRVLSVFARLKQDGVPAAQLERVHAPIGLLIGARSPQEIAVAIVAEVVSVLNAEMTAEKGVRDHGI